MHFSAVNPVVGDGGGARAAPPHISGKKIFRQMPWKIPAFSDKYYVNFSHFRANITHNSGILLIFHTHLQVKMSPPKLTELLWAKQVRLGPQKRTLQDGFCWSINSIEALHTYSENHAALTSCSKNTSTRNHRFSLDMEVRILVISVK